MIYGDSIRRPYGGIYGITILYKDKNVEYVKFIENTNSECILWVKIDKNAFSYEFIMGAEYIPHEITIYCKKDIFETFEEEFINIKIKYDLPVCLIGDFNARTASMNNFLTIDNNNAHESGLNDTNRFNCDKGTSNNGYKLIKMCKNLDIQIVNWRFGNDFKKDYKHAKI